MEVEVQVGWRVGVEAEVEGAGLSEEDSYCGQNL
jgi:hypothetical protein